MLYVAKSCWVRLIACGDTINPTMSDNLITQYGRALYGARWYTPMADDLGVAQRTVRRWAAGEYDPPPGVWDELRALAARKSRELTDLARGKR